MPVAVAGTHINRALTDFSLAVVQSAQNFAALRAVQTLGTDKDVDVYRKYSTADFHRREVAKRLPSSPAKRAGWTIDNTNTFRTERYALAHDISPEDDARADDDIDNDLDATTYLTLQMLLELEAQFVAAFLTSGCGWATERAGTTHFTKFSSDSSDPISYIRNARYDFVHAKTGLTPRVMTVPLAVHNRLLDHPDIIARLDQGQTPGGPALANAARLAQIFDMDEYHVSGSVEESANEGATSAPAVQMPDNILISYKSPVISRRIPTAALRFAWRGLNRDYETRGFSIRTYDLSEKDGGGRSVEVETHHVFKIVAPELGLLLTDVL